MGNTILERIARLSQDATPGLWQQEKITCPARSDVTVPHIFGRVPDLVEVGDVLALDTYKGEQHEGTNIPRSEWFANDPIPVDAIPPTTGRPEGHPLVEIVEVNPAYVKVRNWTGLVLDVGLVMMARQGLAIQQADGAENNLGVFVNFYGDPKGEIPGGTTVDFFDITTYTMSLYPSVSAIPSAYDWDFGDGSAHSTLHFPSHQYDDPGTYDVTFRVVLVDGTIVSVTKVGYIVVTA